MIRRVAARYSSAKMAVNRARRGATQQALNTLSRLASLNGVIVFVTDANPLIVARGGGRVQKVDALIFAFSH